MFVVEKNSLGEIVLIDFDVTKPKIILTLHAPYKIVNFDGPRDKIVDKISEIMQYPVEQSV